jgi:hypothetical protein
LLLRAAFGHRLSGSSTEPAPSSMAREGFLCKLAPP